MTTLSTTTPFLSILAAAAALATATAAIAADGAATVTTTTEKTVTQTTVTVPATPAAPMAMPAGNPARASAQLKGGATGMGDGEVTMDQQGDAVLVHVVAGGLAPGSTHGFHVHDKGVCAGPDFMSAGGHFNPAAHAHGGQEMEHHAGDMPNLVADSNGRIDAKLVLHGVWLGGNSGLVGHAVVLHAMPDDYHTQPTGNAGPRLACGVLAAGG